jgi:hypothetical protein
MFANDSVVPISSKHTGCSHTTYAATTLTEIGSRGDADTNSTSPTEAQTDSKNAKCSGGSIIHRSTRRSSRTASISHSSLNIPNLTESLGVHQLARIDLESSSDQPTIRGRRSLPDLELHVGQVQVSKYALVDTLGKSRSTITSSTNDSTTLGVEPMGDSKLMWGVK